MRERTTGTRGRLAAGFLFVAAAIGVVTVSFSSQQPKAATAGEAKVPPDSLYEEMALFADIVSTVRSEYVDETEAKKLVYGALRGMLSSLDDYSEFLDPDEFQEIKAEAKGEFGGVGIEIGMRDGIVTVIAPMSGSPADRAGVKAGDRIVKIDGKITKKMTLEEAVKALRGEPGTAVHLTLWREKLEKIVDADIKREIIKLESVKQSAILEDRIGYIRLVEFQENTPGDLAEAAGRLQREGMDALILDLRNNPGGLLDAAVAVAELFLEKGSVVVSTRSRVQSQNMEFRAKGQRPIVDIPLVVMVDEGSASASEIVAGAIQDNKRGLVVGMRSYGKGSVQTLIPQKDGSAVRLTTASYCTPSGRSIRGGGIDPDVVVDQSAWEPAAKKSDIFEKVAPREEEMAAVKKSEGDHFEWKQDGQLVRAIDVVKGFRAFGKLGIGKV